MARTDLEKYQTIATEFGGYVAVAQCTISEFSRLIEELKPTTIKGFKEVLNDSKDNIDEKINMLESETKSLRSILITTAAILVVYLSYELYLFIDEIYQPKQIKIQKAVKGLKGIGIEARIIDGNSTTLIKISCPTKAYYDKDDGLVVEIKK
jgi:hypothetical protein